MDGRMSEWGTREGGEGREGRGGDELTVEPTYEPGHVRRHVRELHERAENLRVVSMNVACGTKNRWQHTVSWYVDRFVKVQAPS